MFGQVHDISSDPPLPFILKANERKISRRGNINLENVVGRDFEELFLMKSIGLQSLSLDLFFSKTKSPHPPPRRENKKIESGKISGWVT